MQLILNIRFARKAIIVLIVILVLLSIGFISEIVRRDVMDKHSPPGEFVDYEQSKIHYIKKGTGDKTVVFSSGNGTSSPYADMYHVQNEISPHAETIVYERPGYGWSDSTTRSRSIDTMTDEMKKVLDEASENHSFIFVGHSMAALEIFSYAQKYPEKVDGIVLMDGVHPQYASDMESSIPLSIHLTKFLKNTGSLRLLSNFKFFQDNLVQGEHLPDHVKNEGISFALDRMWNKTILQERKAIPENGKQVSTEGNLGDTPLVIFSASKNPMDGWTTSQETLPEMSDNAEQIWIDTDDHFVHHEESGMIVEEIKNLLKSKEGSE
ncbi:hypothetical protein CAI16_19835 [Virgibacillus dokdonensis]|uniref:AB hydrolase-1 domain-containing protein n=1 Tax=Virgibacillus dokdonensis TaxID=302167 RepID=A0A3E0WH64_9BACI|nr:alpha/beta hydrolase [Virgibacillus dokdonensis]RFA31789.1 hypothetical protein CAI16_19835 [Virgibacillus dokdonensis]